MFHSISVAERAINSFLAAIWDSPNLQSAEGDTNSKRDSYRAALVKFNRLIDRAHSRRRRELEND